MIGVSGTDVRIEVPSYQLGDTRDVVGEMTWVACRNSIVGLQVGCCALQGSAQRLALLTLHRWHLPRQSLYQGRRRRMLLSAPIR
jgi:hypothetical protein